MTILELDQSAAQSAEVHEDQHPTYEIDELLSRTFDAISERPGSTTNASRLYEKVFDRPYEPSDEAASQARLYIQLAFIPKHTFGKRFYEHAAANGISVQIGTMHAICEPAQAVNIYEANNEHRNLSDSLLGKKRSRVYRVHRSGEYNSDLHTGKEIKLNHFIEWEPAFKTVTAHGIDLEQPYSEPIIVEEPATKPKKKSGHRKNLKPASKVETEPKSDILSESFRTLVKDAILAKVEEGLMVDGEISARAIQHFTASRKIGTTTNRERLFGAGLIKRDQLDLEAPMTAVQLIFAEIFNTREARNVLGQRTPQRKAAVMMIEQSVKEELTKQKELSKES